MTKARVVAGTVLLLAACDARRPASWIALALGGWIGWRLAVASAACAGAAAVLGAAVAAVVAIGDLPAGSLLPGRATTSRGWSPPWAAERAAWPLAGILIGRCLCGGDVGPAVAGAAFGTLLAVLTCEAVRHAGAKAADAASLTIVAAVVSVAITVAAGVPGAVATAAVWSLLDGLMWAWARFHTSAEVEPTAGTASGDGLLAGIEGLQADVLPASGPLRRSLTAAAMAAALAMMAGWLVFEPAGQVAADGRSGDAALAWGLLAAAWFLGLAVPQATLQDGAAGAAAWDRLLRSAARADRGAGRSRRWLVGPRPGPVRCAAGVAWSLAAILAWPAAISAAVSLAVPSAAYPPLAVVVGLAILATVVTAGVAVTTGAGATRETAFAGVMAAAVLLGAVAWDLAWAARTSPSFASLALLPVRGRPIR